MADACYTARQTTKQQVLDGIEKLTLLKNENGQYTHDAILLFQKGVTRVLISQFNPSDPGNGMKKLLDDGVNLLTRVKATDAVTAGAVLQASKAKAAQESTSTGTTVAPIIVKRIEAQEEADRLNVINQSVIGAKEGVTEGVTLKVGSDITDAILRTADGSDHKSVDDYTLYEVMQAAIEGADRPSATDVLEQVMEIIHHPFDFRKKISVNMELMQSNAARMATYGITIGIPQLTLTLLANIETACKAEYGREFRSAMQTIRKAYQYNYVHDSTSLAFILKELVGADGVRDYKEAPAPSPGAAHSVTDAVTFLQQMIVGDNDDYSESAFGVSTDSDSLKETRRAKSRSGRDKTKTKDKKKDKKKDKRKSKKKDEEWEKNDCPHCKKFHRKKPHKVEPEKCMWNKKYKGYRFKSICDELEVEFKPRHTFSAELGGYEDSDTD
jgi:hypothetical protein